MARQRSPSYPAISITQAIEFIGKIHKSCRSNVIDRETAARELGYSGLTGRSMKVLADLVQFNLLEKTGKGDVKVTQLAVDILHGIDPADRQQAMLEAALAPQLFKDIHDRFPDGIPSENAIKSYLIQQDFMDVAIGPAISAFMSTYRAVEHIRESESHGGGGEEAPESVHANEPKEQIVSTAPQIVPQHATPVLAASGDMPAILSALAKADLNDIGMSIVGGRIAVAGMLDLKGLRALKRKIIGMEALLAVDEDGEDEDGASE